MDDLKKLLARKRKKHQAEKEASGVARKKFFRRGELQANRVRQYEDEQRRRVQGC